MTGGDAALAVKCLERVTQRLAGGHGTGSAPLDSLYHRMSTGALRKSRLAALPGALDAVFSRTGVHKALLKLHIRNALLRYRDLAAPAEARPCV